MANVIGGSRPGDELVVVRRQDEGTREHEETAMATATMDILLR